MNSVHLVFINRQFSAPDSNLASLPAGVSFHAETPSQINIVVGSHCKLTLLEEHVAGMTSLDTIAANMMITLEAGAQLTYYKIHTGQHQIAGSVTTTIHQQENSSAELMHIISGTQSAREHVAIQLAGINASFTSSGLYCLQNTDQHSDIYISVTHAASHTHSDMLYKGILNKNARAAFTGHVQVEQHAQKITAQQANHHLLLSRQAEAYSKPELEIYADDVKCKHGSTTGQLDQEALFYLRARGIQHDDAMNMLLDGFAQAVIDRAPVEMRASIHTALRDELLAQLSSGQAAIIKSARPEEARSAVSKGAGVTHLHGDNT